MTDAPPDRLCAHPKSPHHDATTIERGVGIRFNGVERNDVEEYCLSEGWIKIAVGKRTDRHGRPMTFKLTGKVEAYFRDAPPEA